jgi:hypothetical protein
MDGGGRLTKANPPVQWTDRPPKPPKPPQILYIRLMTQDNAYSFASFAAIGGYDYEGERIGSLRIFADYESACDYARDILNDGFDYAYVAGVNPDGTLATKDVTRVADNEPSVVNL